MPELPEVEITRRGLQPHTEAHTIVDIVVRNPHLRWPIDPTLGALARGQAICALQRRGKYLIMTLERGHIIVHLGMSGSLRIVPARAPASVHEHLDIVLDNQTAVRLRDPRRFGAVLWTAADPMQHPRLATLGIEPLSAAFDGEALYRLTRCRTAIKTVLMDSRRIAGIGNIYANESLFHAGIHPALAALTLTQAQAARLAGTVRETLERAILAGGSSLRDFVGSDGQPGYFQQQYAVYGRTGQTCLRCGRLIEQIRQAQRSSFFCPGCQKQSTTS